MLKIILFYLTLVIGFLNCGGSTDVLYNSKLYTRLLRLRSLPYEDCGSEYDIVYLKISSCSTIPCEMVRGSNVYVQTVFNDNDEQLCLIDGSSGYEYYIVQPIPPNRIFGTYVLSGSNTQFLKHRVRWIFNAVKTEATISPDPCNGQDKCIFNENEGKSYWASVLVNKSLPVMRGTMLWEAGDEYNKSLICFKVPVTITLG